MKMLSERIASSEDKRASALRLSSFGRIMPANMAATTPAIKRKASIEDLEEMGARATQVIDEARRLSLEPENKKTLRTFSMSEMCQLLDLHPTAYYDLIRTNPEFEGNKVERNRLFTLQEIHRMQGFLKKLPRQRYAIERAITISVANFKGGVAKTFTAVTLAQYLAMRGYRTLVIDTDPQASLTSSFGLDSTERERFSHHPPVPLWPARGGTPGRDVAGVVQVHDPADLLVRARYRGGRISRSIRANSSWDCGARWRGTRMSRSSFTAPSHDALEDVRGDYDVIVIDNPPALSLSTTGAIFAADGLILPTPAETLDFESARAFMRLAAEILKAVRASFGTNKELEIFRILITRFAELPLAQEDCQSHPRCLRRLGDPGAHGRPRRPCARSE